MCFEPLKVIWLNALMHWPNQQWEQKPPGPWLGLVISCKLCDEHVALRGVLSSTSFGFVFRNKLLWISWTIEQLKSRRTRLRPNRRAISIVVDVLNYQQEVDETTRRCHFQATSKIGILQCISFGLYRTCIRNNSKITSCLIQLKEYSQAIDAAKKANTPKTWKSLIFSHSK